MSQLKQMEKLCLSSTQAPTISHPFLPPLHPASRLKKRVSFPHTKFSVFAAKDDSNSNDDKLSQWDLMELKFGKMLGEDPKLTLAKIAGRKMNPDASYIEIEKDFYRNKGKVREVKEVPFDVPEKLGSKKVANGLNLVKPVPKKGIIVGGREDSPKLPEIKRPSDLIRSRSSGASTKSSAPNVILRKPSVFDEKEDEVASSSRLKIKPNLSLSMRTEPVKENFSGMTLLKRPQASMVEEDLDGEIENNTANGLNYVGLNKAANDSEDQDLNERKRAEVNYGEVTMLEKPNVNFSMNAEGDATNSLSGIVEGHIEGFTESGSNLASTEEQPAEVSQAGMQHLQLTDAESPEKEIGLRKPSLVRATASESSVDSGLLQRPKRLDQQRKEMPNSIREGTTFAFAENIGSEGDQDEQPMSQSFESTEDSDWARVEQHFKFGDRVDVELINCSPRGFVVSYGSLIGFLPYRNLAAKWKFLAFESWLRKNGLDPSNYRQNLGVIGSDEGPNASSAVESSSFSEVNEKAVLQINANMELEDLLKIYDQEKMHYLTSYVGQRIKVNILLADQRSKKLIFSMRPKEKEEIVEKKRSLMAKLSVGDVVKCYIKKITYFGIFVEVEGFPALVHQTEVSWDATLEPAAYLKIGQVVEAKVHQLDFALERIFLSLKEITPDPLNEALECIVGNCNFSGGLEDAQADSEWADVDSLMKELLEVDGVQTVTKGRYFLSPGLAPTFQVYMASMFENQYKLLARSGNRVQEVMVQASLDKEEMKSAILQCTNRVEL